MENSTAEKGCRFPNEILLYIIKLATQCVGERSILDWMEPSEPPNPLETGRLPFDQICDKWNGIEIRGLVDPQTRLNLALVSKTLYSMMLPILYHTVVLTKQSHLESFAALVQERHDHEFTHLVKILGVDIIEWDDGAGQLLGATIRDVYLRCPNLIAFDDYPHMGLIQFLPALLSSEEMERYSPRLQYLHAAELLGGNTNSLRPHSAPPHLFYQNISLYSQLRYLSLAFEDERPTRHAPKLCLPNLELLSITAIYGYDEEIDAYLAQAELPKLHTLHIMFDSNFPNSPLVSPLEEVRELLKAHGNKLVTLKIRDEPHRYSDEGEQELSFQLQGYLSNLQQLIVNEECQLSVLHEMRHCPSLHTLEFTDIQPGKWRSGRGLHHLLVGNPLRRFGFESVRAIRFSTVPSLSGHEYVNSVVETWIPRRNFMEGLDAFIKSHRKPFEDEGIELVSKIEIQPQEV
jgi:hypothetical protein